MNVESVGQSLQRNPRAQMLADMACLFDHDEIIDVRSPSEFAEDHVPGAINCPVLDDQERALIGTLYKQVSAFEAKKRGAALVARNIAQHLETHFIDRPRGWRPLIYCWRGGSRSGAMAHILRQVGWQAMQLEGGYKAYRRHVVAELETLPAKFDFRVVCGLTGSGKSRLLESLAANGAQVLDLEQLAAHRGSVLGNLPDKPQPAQKSFDSAVWFALRNLSPERPLFVEAESRKVGELRVPAAVSERMWASQCVKLELPTRERVALLREDYAHFEANPGALFEKLDCLAPLYSVERISHWKQLAESGQWDVFVQDMLLTHYDPAYTRSTLRNYPQLASAPTLSATSASPEALTHLARQLLADTERGLARHAA